MNGIPVLKSKLIMPELPGDFLLTDRLRKLHQAMDSCRAVAVCAPAGYGKTTLAVSYFNRQTTLPSRICWYRPDQEDKNPAVFISHLVQAIFPTEAAEFAESRKALENLTNTELQPNHVISIICREMWTHYGQADHALTHIVLDDFQNVAQNPDICDMIRYMLDNLPPTCVIFILNRTNLNIFTEKQKLEKKILEISTYDLAFNNSEIEELIQSISQTATDSKLGEIIKNITEGWIAGIIILWQAIKNKERNDASINIEKLVHEEALFRYMSLEVLKTVDDDTQDSLTRLALLQDFSEAEASEILEIGDIKKLLERCMGFGMFIQRIPGEPVVYRFHSLFREFLIYSPNNRCSDIQIAEIHLKAAGYYMKNEIFGRAAEHLTKCGNSTSSMDMVTKAGFNKFMIGESGQLKLWLDLLPNDLVMDNPVLLLFKAQLMPNSRQPEMVDTLKRVLRLSLQDNNLALYYDVASVLIYILMCRNDMNGLIEITADLPLPPRNVSAELENTLVIIDIVHSIGEEQFTAAQTHSESIMYALLSEDSKWLYLILSCISCICLGKLDQGEQYMKTALELIRFKNIEPSKGFILLFFSIILSLKNQREFLQSNIDEIISIGQKYNYEYLSAHGSRLAAFERYLSFKTNSAVEALDQASFLFLRISNSAMAAACRLLRRLWAIQSGRSGGHTQVIEESVIDVELIRKVCPGIMVYESSLSVLGAIARESGDYILSERSLLSAINSAKTKKGYQVLCGSLFHTAGLYYAKGDNDQGYCYLTQALDLAASNRYFMFWDIHIPTITEMALRGIRYGYCSSYAEELLGKFFSGKAVNYLIEKMKSIDEGQLTAFARGFISACTDNESEYLYFVKASLFGKTKISVNGVEIPDYEWKTKKVKGFIEYLLLNSGNTISKEQLAEIFWPESDSKAAIASQRTALYHLRKVLSRYHVEVTGNNAFIYETPEGLLIRKNDTLELDIYEFLRLYETYRNQAVRKKDDTRTDTQAGMLTDTLTDTQAGILEKMISIYKGDLMEGSDYGDMVYHERERFCSIFVEVCRKLSAIYIKRGELQQAEKLLIQALANEPYNENVCLELLKLYMSQGRKSKAVRFYYNIKNRLEQELGMKVDKRLTEALRNP